jgi:putative oxidoreductase
MKERMMRIHGMFEAAASSLQSALLLLVRLYWGWQFAQTGWGKLQHLSKVGSFFAALGVPFPHVTAVCIALLEFCGGILLGIGLGSRLIALALAADMLVAYIVADTAALTSFFSDPGKFYAADPFTFLAASLIVLIFGPGRFALDTLVARFMRFNPSENRSSMRMERERHAH